MYRMRSISALLDTHRELENQEIFFCDPKDLNDPMEGFVNFAWAGDRILWRNFLRHYLLCLEHVALIASLKTDEESFGIEDIPIMKTIDNLPTEMYRNLFAKLSKDFLADPQTKKLVALLERRQTPIGRVELLFYLRMIHFRALGAVLKSHREVGFGPKDIPEEFFKVDVAKVVKPILENLKDFEKDPKMSQTLFEVFATLNGKQFLTLASNDSDVPRSHFKRFLLFEFPEAFVERVRELSYPSAYVSCFFENCTNAALWGYYADNHRGVSLKFKDRETNGRKSLRLNSVVGWSNGPIDGKVDLTYEKIDYVSSFQSVDFFRSLGRLPLAKIDRYWFSEPDGTTSKVAAPYGQDAEEWRKNYWQTHLKSLTTKLSDWEIEQEQRLVLTDMLMMFSDPKIRKLKYDFDELEGIVFGFRTTVLDKVRIIRLLEKKCAESGRKGFQIFQANYVPREGKMRIDELYTIGADA